MLALVTRPVPVLPVTGAVAWYDASDLSTLVLSGQKVTQWNSKAGGGNVAQGTDANRPLANGSINGLNALTFDGSNDSLVGTNPHTVQPITWFAVALSRATSGQRMVISTYNNSPGVSDLDMYRHTAGSIRMYAGVEVAAAGGVDWVVGTPHVVTVLLNGASSLIARDGRPATTSNAGSQNPSGVNMTIGAQTSGNAFWLGMIGEVVMYSSALSPANRLAVEQYLIQKWLY